MREDLARLASLLSWAAQIARQNVGKYPIITTEDSLSDRLSYITMLWDASRLNNPYDPPQSESNRDRSPTLLRCFARNVTFGFGGAFGGYVILVVLANMESWQFYTIRSTFTGETAMANITMHPADPWIKLAIFATCIGGGLVVGLLVGRRGSRRTST